MLPEVALCAVALLAVNTSPIAINRANKHCANLFVIAVDSLLNVFRSADEGHSLRIYPASALQVER
jgi:hypothetical protein